MFERDIRKWNKAVSQYQKTAEKIRKKIKTFLMNKSLKIKPDQILQFKKDFG